MLVLLHRVGDGFRIVYFIIREDSGFPSRTLTTHRGLTYDSGETNDPIHVVTRTEIQYWEPWSASRP